MCFTSLLTKLCFKNVFLTFSLHCENAISESSANIQKVIIFILIGYMNILEMLPRY